MRCPLTSALREGSRRGERLRRACFAGTPPLHSACPRHVSTTDEGRIIPSEQAPSPATYTAALREYLDAHEEGALYQASLIGAGFVEQGIGPDEIIALHAEALNEATQNIPFRRRATAGVEALQFLLETMIAYGVQHQRYLELRTRTAETQAAALRLRIEDAERAAQEKAAVLATIAHELNTPITAARGMVDLATRALKRGDGARAQAQMDSARTALERLARLSSDLHRASRDEPPVLDRQVLDLTPLLAQAAAWAATAASEKGLRLRDEIATEPLPVEADNDALLTVFGNLLANAVRYTPTGGAVTLRCGSTPREVWVEVTDTGIGMSPDVQTRVFEKFYRAPEAKEVVAQGLGLGLSLVRDIVAGHGGEIALSSAPGEGSVFRVTLPRAAQPAEEQRDG